MLTDKINTLGLKMMDIQFQKENIEDELLGLYDQLNGYTDNGDSSNVSSSGNYSIEDIHNRYGISNYNSSSNANNKNKDYELQRQIRETQNRENRLDQLLKKYETLLTAAQNELQTVEQEEGQAIKLSTPKYTGVGGQ